MTTTQSHRSSRLHVREVAFVLILVLFAGAFTLGYQRGNPGFVSSEVRFTDPSESGLAIVPASCPSNPHYAGECSYTVTGTCTPQYFCSGQYGNRYYRNASCQESFVETCEYGCYEGQCIAAQGMRFAPYTGSRANGATFNGSGHLQINPALVRSGDSTRVYWNVLNATSCTVTGTNGDSWTVSNAGCTAPNAQLCTDSAGPVTTSSFSGSSGRVTGPITQRVVYTLTCTRNGSAQVINETEVVNLIPTFQDQ